MKLIAISSDRNLFKKGSDVWNRYLDYGKLFEEIHVIVFSAKKLGNKEVKIGNNVFIHPTDHICKFLYLWDTYIISGQIIKNLKFKIKNYRDDIVVSSQDPFESGLAGWMLKKTYNIPLQIQIHTDLFSPYFWRGSFVNKLRVILAKFLIPRADSVRVVSERIKRSLFNNLKNDVLPIFVDIGSIKNAPIGIDLHKKYPQFDLIILMASRLTKEKNIDMAVEAVAELVKKYPKLGLVIVGSGPEEADLKLKIKNLKLHGNVVLEGWLGDLSSYYKTADLFLLTSNYEGYGRTVIEAIAAGLPVVMTDVGLAGEVLIDDKNGAVIPVGDKEALVRTAELLMNDDKKKDAFALEGKKTLENLMTKEQYLKLYKEIMVSANYEK
jgi:glycosyltransferase involved in cell wall biosynthesis